MNILFVRANQGYPDSRVEKEIYSLSKEHHVELLGWDRTKSQRVIDDRLITINGKQVMYHLICISAPQGAGFKKIAVPMFKYWISVTKYIKRNAKRFDVIHFCDFDTAAIAFKVAKSLKLKTVYDIFDYYADSHSAPNFIKNEIRKRENEIIKDSDVVLICSEKRVEQIKPAIPKRLVIIHNTPSDEFELANIAFSKGSVPNKVKLVYVGMLSDDRFLREIAETVRTMPQIEWHVAGFGYLQDYFETQAKNNDNIFFYGKLNYMQALYLESACDIMTAIYDPAVPNHKYAAPNKFYEALMLGKPLIMAKNTGMDYYLSEYGIGEVMDLNDNNFKSEFKNALIRIIDKNNFDEIRNIEHELYNDKFSWSEMEKRLLGAYECLGLL